ncbi:Formyltransferase [Pseudovirgaria hyperparasitica]|uniref:Formyltransferase n=1 Tax=Pseudovirgaria hyperparasitica TaxID=470096 RepID=A0A6A6WB32_9PEZI|nr:Formyltransferase [Pseudovirgaria hyperparasitica]KAF2759775.1 Formyltransferase [Pseudovirgaria hyperparasitica]
MLIHAGRRLFSVPRQGVVTYTRCFSTIEDHREPLRILYCGTDAFSTSSLIALDNIRKKFPRIIESIQVLHKSEKPTGRGLKVLSEIPIQKLSRSLGLDTYHISHSNEIAVWTPPKEYNLIIAVSFGLFIPRRLIESAKYGGLNVHPSLLPDLRGAAPIHHALLLKRPVTGVTIQTLDVDKFDHGLRIEQSGPIDLTRGEYVTLESLSRKLGQVGSQILAQCIMNKSYLLGPNTEAPKDGGWSHSPCAPDDERFPPISPAPKITPEMKQIKWETQTFEDIALHRRVLGPTWDKSIHAMNKRIIFHRFEFARDASIFKDLLPGESITVSSPDSNVRTPYVKTCDGPDVGLKMLNWTVEGKRPNCYWIPKKPKSRAMSAEESKKIEGAAA